MNSFLYVDYSVLGKRDFVDHLTHVDPIGKFFHVTYLIVYVTCLYISIIRNPLGISIYGFIQCN